MERAHHYTTELEWTGADAQGTLTYEGYSREHKFRVPGKPDIISTADPAFRGDPQHHNPEDLLMAALAGCHMLTYLALCARKRIVVKSYRDTASGRLLLTRDGGGQFTEVVLRPIVEVTDAAMVETAHALHSAAHKYCFIARSVNFTVRNEPTITVAGT